MKDMGEERYGVIEEKQKQPEFPVRRLLKVPHQGGVLVVSRDAFGPSYLNANVAKMHESYCYPNTWNIISFREPTTSESISAAAYDFGKMAKPEILDSRRLQLGRILKTSEGVFTNPPKDEQGNPITDEKTLKSLLNKAEKVNGIYLLANDFGFAPYETFTQKVQDCDTFAQGGLARVLEHTPEEKAKNLRVIASPEFYKDGINVWGFDDVKKPILKVVSLNSGRGPDGGRLVVVGDDWGVYYFGCAFGVLDESAEGASQKSK